MQFIFVKKKSLCTSKHDEAIRETCANQDCFYTPSIFLVCFFSHFDYTFYLYFLHVSHHVSFLSFLCVFFVLIIFFLYFLSFFSLCLSSSLFLSIFICLCFYHLSIFITIFLSFLFSAFFGNYSAHQRAPKETHLWFCAT